MIKSRCGCVLGVLLAGWAMWGSLPARAETNASIISNFNAGVVDPVKQLPSGWEALTFPGLETVYELTTITNASRSGRAVEMLWKNGTPKFGIIQNAPVPVMGSSAYEMSAWVKTEGEGAVSLGMTGYDTDGKTVTVPLTLSPIHADKREWEEIRWTFSTTPSVACLKLACLNMGKGRVWFGDVQLHYKAGAVARKSSLPIKISLEPVCGNYFWQNDEYIFNTIQGSPCGLSFMIYGNKAEFKQPRLHVELPAGVKVEEIEAIYAGGDGGFRMECLVADKTPTARGVKYTVTVPEKIVKIPGDISQISESKPKIMFYFDRAVETTPADVTVYWSVENGGIASGERRFTLRFLPPLEKSPNPRAFRGGLFQMNDVNIADPGLLDRVLSHYEEAGINTKYIIAQNTPQVNKRLAERGWELREVVFSLHEALPRGWMPRPLCDNIRVAVDADGKSQTNTSAQACPTFALNNPEYHQWFKKYTQGAIAAMSNGAAVCFDYEPFGVPARKCFCDECRAEFCRRFKIDPKNAATSKQILTNYENEWGQFWCQLVYDMHVEAIQAIKETHPKSPIQIYDYTWDFDSPKIGHALFSCPLDERMIDNIVDAHFLSTAGKYGNDLLGNLDMMRKWFKKEINVDPRISRYVGATGGYTSRKDTHTPATFRLQLIGAAASGCKEWMIYPGPFIDGMFFQEMNRAMREISVVEDFYARGRRCEAEVSVVPADPRLINPQEGIGLNAARLGKYGYEYENGKQEDIGVRAHRLDGQTLVTLMNYNAGADAFLRVKVQGTPWWAGVWNPVEKRWLMTGKGGKTWWKPELRKGIPCRVPAQGVLFLVVGPRLDVPSDFKAEPAPVYHPDKSGAASPAVPVKTMAEGEARLETVEDLSGDQAPEIKMENASEKLWISLADGGRVLRWEDKQSSAVITERGDRKGFIADMFWDTRWLPPEMRSKADTVVKYTVKNAMIEKGVPVLTVSGKHEQAIEVQKTYRLTGSRQLEISYTIRNVSPEEQEYGFWSRHCPTLGLTNDFGWQSVVVAMGSNGVMAITEDAAHPGSAETVLAVRGAGATGGSAVGIQGELVSGKFAFYVPASKQAIQVEVDLDQVAQLYTCGMAKIRTLEWMYRSIVLAPGESQTTVMKFKFLTDVPSPADALR